MARPKTLTRAQLIELLAQRGKLTRGRAEEVVKCVFQTMTRTLLEDAVAEAPRSASIEIRGFGTFSVRRYEAYKGRNPKTRETVEVAGKKLPFFKVGKELRDQVNANAHLPLPMEEGSEEDSDADGDELDDGDDE